MKLDRAILGRLWPHAPAVLLDAVASRSAQVFAKYKIDTPLRVAHFMAQVSHESNGGTITAENMNYTTATRIAAVWPSRFSVESAQGYVRNARKLANKVYSGRMGNAVGSDDGYNYRGRGLLQLTGRESYKRIGQACGLPLEENPELAFAPANALNIAAAEFTSLGCLPFCDKDDLRNVTRRVNGGTIGLDSRKAWLSKWKLALPELPDTLPASDDDVKEVDAQPPRSAEPAPTKDIGNSTIANGAKVGGGLTVMAILEKVWEKITELPDNIVHALTDLAQQPSFWLIVAAGGAFAYIFWRRHKKLVEEGV